MHDHPEPSSIFRPASLSAERVPGQLPVAAWQEEEFRDWPPLKWPDEPIRAPEPARRTIWLVRALIAAGTVALAFFFAWLFEPERRGDAWLFWPLAVAMAYRALWWLFEWVHYACPKFEPLAVPSRAWTADVLTTACPGEPRGMILRTLRAMKAIRYPHTDWLCDEGDDPVLRAACATLGIRHVTRTEKTDAKAGNINNALAQATGEIRKSRRSSKTARIFTLRGSSSTSASRK